MSKAKIGTTIVTGEAPGVYALIVQLPAKLYDVKKRLILTTLKVKSGNMTASARALGMSRRALYNCVQKYGWKRPALTGAAA